VIALAAAGLGAASQRTVAMLGIAGWGFFTAAFLPVFTLGLAWRGATGAGAVAALLGGGAVDVALELNRAHLPAGLEPGLAGAAFGMLVMVAVSTLENRSQVRMSARSEPEGEEGNVKGQREDKASPGSSISRFPFSLSPRREPAPTRGER